MFRHTPSRSYKPVKPQGHEGVGTEGRVAFSNAQRSWEEVFDLLAILETVLRNQGIASERQEGWLMLPNDLCLRPEIVMIQPLDQGGVRTMSTIAIAHEKCAPAGLFEFQHATGNDTNSAFTAGFEGWSALDLPVLQDVIEEQLNRCAGMDMEFPGSAHRVRRAVLGPVSHVASRDADVAEEHPFCPCCLLTNSFEAFRSHFDSEATYGIRLLVLRNEQGEVSADCRVNGIDWELGRTHLVEYGKRWPDRGFEMRKQYVAIYTRGAT